MLIYSQAFISLIFRQVSTRIRVTNWHWQLATCTIVTHLAFASF